MDLQDSMYDYRYEREPEKDIIDTCEYCDMPIYHDEEYRYCNGSIMHDHCADEYNDEDDEE